MQEKVKDAVTHVCWSGTAGNSQIAELKLVHTGGLAGWMHGPGSSPSSVRLLEQEQGKLQVNVKGQGILEGNVKGQGIL